MQSIKDTIIKIIDFKKSLTEEELEEAGLKNIEVANYSYKDEWKTVVYVRLEKIHNSSLDQNKIDENLDKLLKKLSNIIGIDIKEIDDPPYEDPSEIEIEFDGICDWGALTEVRQAKIETTTLKGARVDIFVTRDGMQVLAHGKVVDGCKYDDLIGPHMACYLTAEEAKETGYPEGMFFLRICGYEDAFKAFIPEEDYIKAQKMQITLWNEFCEMQCPGYLHLKRLIGELNTIEIAEEVDDYRRMVSGSSKKERIQFITEMNRYEVLTAIEIAKEQYPLASLLVESEKTNPRVMNALLAGASLECALDIKSRL